VETTWPVLDLKMKFRECLHPSAQAAFQPLEGTQPFEIVMVGTEDNIVSQQVMSLVLEGRNNRQ